MYDPDTVAHEIRLPWPGHRYGIPVVTIWHHDPERPSHGQRTDDSCGWFERRPREYADAVEYLLKDTELMFEVSRSIASRGAVTSAYGNTYPRMSSGETLAVCLMVANYLELRRWWNGQNGGKGAHGSKLARLFIRKRRVDEVAASLALSPMDNLSSVKSADTLIRLIAGALHRHFKPWYRHPRWHIHHWRLQVHLWQAFRRWAFSRCAGCGKRFAWGYSPTSFQWDSEKPKPFRSEVGVYHAECAHKQTNSGGVSIERSKEWWANKVAEEPDIPIGAGIDHSGHLH